MELATRLLSEYSSIRSECGLATAADAKYAPYLFNTLSSIHERFPRHPTVYVYDLGMTWTQRRELAAVPWLELHRVEPFVPHWKKNWSWKPYLLTQVRRRFVLYFDSAAIVLFRPLELWFLAIKLHGYFLLSNRQTMSEVTPSDYWPLFGLDPSEFGAKPTFGAGLFGFDNQSVAGTAVREAFEWTRQGLTLGCSAGEKNHIYDRSIIRDCGCFRADQTLLNLSMRKHLGREMVVRNDLRYCGLGGPADHPRQYVWYARRGAKLSYFWRPLGSSSAWSWYNRLTARAELELRSHARKVRNAWWRFSGRA